MSFHYTNYCQAVLDNIDTDKFERKFTQAFNRVKKLQAKERQRELNKKMKG